MLLKVQNLKKNVKLESFFFFNTNNMFKEKQMREISMQSLENQPLLEDFKGLVNKELPEVLLPMESIQHTINFIAEATSPNLPIIRMFSVQ